MWQVSFQVWIFGYQIGTKIQRWFLSFHLWKSLGVIYNNTLFGYPSGGNLILFNNQTLPNFYRCSFFFFFKKNLDAEWVPSCSGTYFYQSNHLGNLFVYKGRSWCTFVCIRISIVIRQCLLRTYLCGYICPYICWTQLWYQCYAVSSSANEIFKRHEMRYIWRLTQLTMQPKQIISFTITVYLLLLF